MVGDAGIEPATPPV